MKNVILVAALATSVAFSANAMSAEIDTDGDGLASLVELQVSNPDLTDQVFMQMDTDKSGSIDDDEMLVAINDELILAPKVSE